MLTVESPHISCNTVLFVLSLCVCCVRLKLFMGQHVVPYAGQRDLQALKDFVVQQTAKMEVRELVYTLN